MHLHVRSTHINVTTVFSTCTYHRVFNFLFLVSRCVVSVFHCVCILSLLPVYIGVSRVIKVMPEIDLNTHQDRRHSCRLGHAMGLSHQVLVLKFRKSAAEQR